MIEVDIDSNQFGGFVGVRSGAVSASCFTVKMHVVPRVGETIYVDRALIPEICFTGSNAPVVEIDGQYAGYLALEVMVVSHRLEDSSHRPHLFCRQNKQSFV